MKLLILLLLPTIVSPLHVTSPVQFVSQENSPIYSHIIGLQNLTTIEETFEHQSSPAVFIKDNAKVCDLDQALLRGHVVILSRNGAAARTLDNMRQTVRCVERASGVAIVVLTPFLSHPGFYYNLRDGNALVGQIPVVNVAGDSLQDVVRYLKQNATNAEPVMIRISVDKNAWREIWLSWKFLILWRVVIPALNLVGIVCGIRGLSIHMPRLWAVISQHLNSKSSAITKRNGTVSIPMFLMMLGCCLQFIACCTRVVYCWLDPMYSSSDFLTTLQSNLLMFVPAVAEVHADAIAVGLFVRWRRLGHSHKHQVFIDTVLFCGCMFTLIFEFYLAVEMSLLNMHIVPVFAYLAFHSLATLIASIIFITQGRALIQTLKDTDEDSFNELRKFMVVRALWWIQISGFLQIMQFICMAAGLAFVTTPDGFFSLFTAFVLFLSCGSIAHILAFTPAVGGFGQCLVGAGGRRTTANVQTPPPEPASHGSPGTSNPQAVVGWGRHDGAECLQDVAPPADKSIVINAVL